MAPSLNFTFTSPTTFANYTSCHHHQQPSLPQCYPSRTTPMQLLKTSTSFFLKSRFLDGEFIPSWWSSMTRLIGTGKPLFSTISTKRQSLRSEEHTFELQSHHDLVCR